MEIGCQSNFACLGIDCAIVLGSAGRETVDRRRMARVGEWSGQRLDFSDRVEELHYCASFFCHPDV